MDESLKKELEQLQKNIAGKTKEEVEAQVKALIEGAGLAYHEATEEKFNEIKSFNEQLEADLKTANETIIKMDAAIKENVKKTKGEMGFMEAFAEKVMESKQLFLDSQGNHEVTLNIKAPMLTGNTITGTAVRTYDPQQALNPGQFVNFRQLVPALQSATGIYVFYRETPPTGGVADQTEGSAKANLEFKATEVTVNAAYLAATVDFSRQLATDFPYLQTDLPQQLLREYYKAENSKFYTALSTAATASTEIITGKKKIEMLMNDVAKLEERDYFVNGIVVRPSDWYDILKTEKSTGAGYGVPGMVITENGRITINGIPIIRATWIAANKYLIGDWTRASRVTVAGQGLNTRFFEQNKDNVDKNLVTARIEERNALAVKRPDAFTFGDFTAT